MPNQLTATARRIAVLQSTGQLSVTITNSGVSLKANTAVASATNPSERVAIWSATLRTTDRPRPHEASSPRAGR